MLSEWAMSRVYPTPDTEPTAGVAVALGFDNRNLNLEGIHRQHRPHYPRTVHHIYCNWRSNQQQLASTTTTTTTTTHHHSPPLPHPPPPPSCVLAGGITC
jgi:hypothetical protein